MVETVTGPSFPSGAGGTSPLKVLALRGAAVTWGAASINHLWPWPRKNVVMCYDARLDYSDLLEHQESWGEWPNAEDADELTRRIRVRMTRIMEEIRGEKAPDGYWDFRTMKRVTD